jgi:hypothetical protein
MYFSVIAVCPNLLSFVAPPDTPCRYFEHSLHTLTLLVVLFICRDCAVLPYQMLSLETFFFHLYVLPECG